MTTPYWEFKADGDIWVKYAVVDNKLLNEAYKTPGTIFKTTELSFNKGYGTLYHYNFSEMLQINTESKRKRAIRRIAPDEPPAKRTRVASPAAAVSTAASAASATKAAVAVVAPGASTVAPAAAPAASPAISPADVPAVVPASSLSSAAVASDTKMVKSVAKGGAIVDKIVPNASNYHVYIDKEGTWDAMLNQANVGANNNKFYVIQLLQHDTTTEFVFWNRWGRVGAAGQTSLTSYGAGALDAAKASFRSKFKDKTGNAWNFGKGFEAKKGKYALLEMDYGEDVSASSADSSVVKKDDPPSKLPASVQELIKLICDVNMMTQHMVEIGYDVKKLPLGKLSKKTVADGFTALKSIEKELAKKAPAAHTLQELSSEFFTHIPHDFGFKNLAHFVINTKEKLKDKLMMVEALADIELATKLLDTSSACSLENPIDIHHRKLECKLLPIDSSHDDWHLVNQYIQTTHGKTHTSYKLTLAHLFQVDRQGESERFVSNDNRMLLWHGSRLTNWCGILSQGLRIAPPEAPVTGYMFGKGVYFADCVSKSANYCFCKPSAPRGVMLLCEVALGSINQLTAADYNAKEHLSGKLSTLGAGRQAPSSFKKLSDGVELPMGPLKESHVAKTGTALEYNEYIVYDISQIKMRYVLLLDFDFKK